MFETETEQITEQRRSRMFLMLGGIGALALAIVIVLLSKNSHQPPPAKDASALPGGVQLKLEGALRAGTPDFDNYKGKLTVEDTEIYAAQNMLGQTQFTITSRLTNRGDKTLSGIELTANALGLDGTTVIAKNLSRPIPFMRSTPMKPGESIRVTMKLDTPERITEGDVSNIVPEVTGLIFQ